MPNNNEPHGVIRLEEPLRIDHTLSPEGHLYLEIDHVFPQETNPTLIRVTLTPEHVFRLLTQLEATRQQFGFPLPAVFGQQKTRQ